jgi:GNAT superfamily N-acetyltransferase
MHSLLDVDTAIEIVERHMRTWPMFKSRKHTFTAKAISDTNLYLGFANTHEQRLGDDRYAHWKVNVIGDVFYLLSIAIPQRRRGKGHGDSLYRILEQIAAELGCRQSRQTPSGWTPTGETRRSYLNRRGWENDGAEVFKRL